MRSKVMKVMKIDGNDVVRLAAVSAIFLAVSALTPAEAGWKDRIPAGKDALTVESAAGDIRVDPLAENLFRVRVAKDGAWTESGMNRYGILKRDWPAVKCGKSATSLETAAATIDVDAATGAIRFRSSVSKADLAISAKIEGKGYRVRFPLVDG